jgi:hypothetical protein
VGLEINNPLAQLGLGFEPADDVIAAANADAAGEPDDGVCIT